VEHGVRAARGHRDRDADLFYLDDDTSWDAEDAVIRAGADLFADLPVPVEIRNEARVHLWYADRFGVPAPPFTDCADAIDSCLRGQDRPVAGAVAGAHRAALGRRGRTLIHRRGHRRPRSPQVSSG
jgi:hypothetical protein